MEDSFSRLNKMQREAVLATEGPLLILAGAGSGKTAVLIERCAQIIKNGAPAWAILAITFTNKAAKEIRDRLEQSLGSDGREVWACTFHSACVRILRRDIERLGYGRSFTIYDMDDQKRLMKRVLRDLNYDEKRFAPQAVLSVISKAKDAEQGPRELAAAGRGDFFINVCAECYKEYQRRLAEANALDFDDIIALTVRLFSESPDALAYWQKRFRYILVDEYQDTNLLQYKLVSMLSAGHRNICVVGDDDQSIYRFRGATIENILSFEQTYPDARVIRLEQNYRSTSAILEAANSVISRNKGRKGKTLWTDNGAGEPVTLRQALNENDEARFITDTVLEGVKDGAAFSDYCVLYRTNAQSGRIENALRMSGVPYRVIGGMRFFDRSEIKDMMSYLQVIHNPTDELRLSRILNVPARGIGEKTIVTIRALASRDNTPMFSVLLQADSYPELARSSLTLKRFAEMILSLRESSAVLTLPEFYDEALYKTGYGQMLREKADEESMSRYENVMELRTNLAQYQESDPENASLGGFLDETALFTDIERYDEREDTVTLMTMHAAKGLEFPRVFITGAEEGIFPGNRSQTDPAELEEERRLCYVAATRAKEKLYVLHAGERMLYGYTSRNMPSRFIEEMGLIPDEPRKAREAKPRPVHQPSVLRDRPSVPIKTTTELLRKGDMVEHKQFGRGMVTAVTPMGGDALVEIAFEDKGTRRLMQKSASPFMKKVDN